MFSKHLSNSFTSNTPSPLPGLKRQLRKVTRIDFFEWCNSKPTFWSKLLSAPWNLLQVNDKYISNNINKTFMSFAPIEKRILQRLEALDPSSHWRHARSASLLDFAAAKPSSNLLVVHVRGQSSAHKRNLLQQRREGRHFKRTKLCLSCCGHHSTQVPSLPLISFSDSVIKVKSALKIRTFQNLMDLTNGKPFAAMLLWCPPPWHASLEITPAIISCCISDVIFRSISEVTTPPEDPRG